jgi:membrane dipeptidase
MSSENGERDPLLQNQAIDRQRPQGSRATMARTVIWGLLTLVFAIGLVLVFVFEDNLARWSWSDSLPKDPVAAARKVLGVAPVIVSS